LDRIETDSILEIMRMAGNTVTDAISHVKLHPYSPAHTSKRQQGKAPGSRLASSSDLVVSVQLKQMTFAKSESRLDSRQQAGVGKQKGKHAEKWQATEHPTRLCREAAKKGRSPWAASPQS
jgi:hypothetical protein